MASTGQDWVSSDNKGRPLVGGFRGLHVKWQGPELSVQ